MAALKNMGITADLGLGQGIMQGDVLAAQQKDETDAIKKRNQQNAMLARISPQAGVAQDLGLGSLSGG